MTTKITKAVRRNRNVHTDIARVDPLRSPRWRYNRVESLNRKRKSRRNARPVAGRDDEYVRGASAWLDKWNQLGKLRMNAEELEERRREELYYDNPGMYWAWKLFDSVDTNDLHYVIEANILARRTDEEIWPIVNIIPEGIEWYEALFFNVRDRLSARTYISRQIIGHAAGQGIERIPYDMSAKFFGYFGGPVVLDAVLDGYDHGIVPPSPGQRCDEFFDALWGGSIRYKSAETAAFFRIHKFDVMRLFEAHQQIVAEANRVERDAGPRTPVEESVKAILGAIPWAVGSDRENVISASPIKPYLGHASEPRVSELMLIARGEAPFSPDVLEANVLPEPSKKPEVRDDDAKIK